MTLFMLLGLANRRTLVQGQRGDFFSRNQSRLRDRDVHRSSHTTTAVTIALPSGST